MSVIKYLTLMMKAQRAFTLTCQEAISVQREVPKSVIFGFLNLFLQLGVEKLSIGQLAVVQSLQQTTKAQKLCSSLQLAD